MSLEDAGVSMFFSQFKLVRCSYSPPHPPKKKIRCCRLHGQDVTTLYITVQRCHLVEVLNSSFFFLVNC